VGGHANRRLSGAIGQIRRQHKPFRQFVNQNGNAEMSQTAVQGPFTSLWNMSAPLRLLIIEDSAADAKLCIQELERAGFNCRPQVITSRSEFLAHLPRFPFDIVLADYQLANWMGLDALAILREAGRDIPFILVVGKLAEDAAVETILQGGTDCVPKDNLAHLPIVVIQALEEKSLRDARAFMAEALQRSESNSLFLFADSPLPMWVLERESLQILQVNNGAVRQYGYGRSEFLKMAVSDLHPADEIPDLLAAFRGDLDLIKHARQWHHRLKNGSLIDVEMYLHPMEYWGTSAAGMVVLDITERKRTEEELQNFFTLVENSRDFIAVADLHGNVEYVNPTGRGLLGIASAAAVKATRTVSYIAPADLQLFRETIVPAFSSVGHLEGELRFRNQQTGVALPMDFVGFQVKDLKTGEPRFVATVSRDMADRRALEQQLRQAQKFEAIGQLAGGIAHDFNNVIGAILGWAELGEDRAASSDANLLTYFNKIHTQRVRVTALIRQLLVFARRQTLEPRNISLNQNVREVLNLLGNMLGEDIELKTILQHDLPVIRADPAQIEQVLTNLCINSRDAMPWGVCLTIETRAIEFSEEECRHHAVLQPGSFAELRVSDTGTGMDAAVRERIFEPFFTTKGPGKGTG
jgi:PAS domain S-box-containing protein